MVSLLLRDSKLNIFGLRRLSQSKKEYNHLLQPVTCVRLLLFFVVKDCKVNLE